MCNDLNESFNILMESFIEFVKLYNPDEFIKNENVISKEKNVFIKELYERKKNNLRKDFDLNKLEKLEKINLIQKKLGSNIIERVEEIYNLEKQIINSTVNEQNGKAIWELLSEKYMNFLDKYFFEMKNSDKKNTNDKYETVLNKLFNKTNSNKNDFSFAYELLELLDMYKTLMVKNGENNILNIKIERNFELKFKLIFLYLNSMLDKFSFDFIYKLSIPLEIKEENENDRKYNTALYWIIKEVLDFKNPNKYDIYYLNINDIYNNEKIKIRKIKNCKIYIEFKSSIIYFNIQNLRNRIMHSHSDLQNTEFEDLKISIGILFIFLLVMIYQQKIILNNNK